MTDHPKEPGNRPDTPVQPPQPPPPPVGGLGDGAPTDPRSESPLWRGRADWKHYMGLVLLGFSIVLVVEVLLVYTGTATGLSAGWAVLIGALAALMVVACVASVIAYRILNTHYELTSQRLFIVRGILSQTRDQSELIRIDDVRVHQSLVDRIFGLGTVEVISTDATDNDARIVGVADAKAVAEHIRARMRTLRSKSLFIENL